MSAPIATETLADLRQEIDRIDAAMHALLIERGDIIDRIIAAKARQGGGSAFHPGREAAMMRALAERHEGQLPLDTVESIWRVIISTFTYIQMNYGVHADISGGDAPMRDAARFHFGFTVPYLTHNGALGVIEAVARSKNDLGMLRIDSSATAGAWWMRLAEQSAPKVIARLPFVERPDHPAGLPLFVIARPLAETPARAVVLHAVQIERWREGIPAGIARLDGEILGNAGHGYGLSLLIALPGNVPAAGLRQALVEAGAGEPRLAEAGSHAARFEIAAQPHAGERHRTAG